LKRTGGLRKYSLRQKRKEGINNTTTESITKPSQRQKERGKKSSKRDSERDEGVGGIFRNCQKAWNTFSEQPLQGKKRKDFQRAPWSKKPQSTRTDNGGGEEDSEAGEDCLKNLGGRTVRGGGFMRKKREETNLLRFQLEDNSSTDSSRSFFQKKSFLRHCCPFYVGLGETGQILTQRDMCRGGIRVRRARRGEEPLLC